jgi:hypothetical protein
MRITLAPDPAADGTRRVAWGTEPEPGWFTWDATQHELDDLAALLAIDTAKATTCPETDGDHSCVLAPRHTGAMPHQCRACPHQWLAA